MKKTIPIFLLLLGISWLFAGGCKGYHDACKMAGGKLESGAPNKYEFCRVKAEAAAKDACEERAKKSVEVHPLPDPLYKQSPREKPEWPGFSKFELVSLAVQVGDHMRKGDVVAMMQEVIAVPGPTKAGTVSAALVAPGDTVTMPAAGAPGLLNGKDCMSPGECQSGTCEGGLCQIKALVKIDVPVPAPADGIVRFLRKGCTCTAKTCTSTNDFFKPGDGVKKSDTIVCLDPVPKGTVVSAATQDAGSSSPAAEVVEGLGIIFAGGGGGSGSQGSNPPENGVLLSISAKEDAVVAKGALLYTVTLPVGLPTPPPMGTTLPLDLKVHTVAKPGDPYSPSATDRAPVTLLSPNMEARGPSPVTAPTAGWVVKVKPKVGDLVGETSPVVFLNVAEDRCEVSPDPNTTLPRKLEPFPECSEDDRQQSCVARCIWLSANCADIGKLAECSRAWREYELGTQPCPLDAGGKKQSTCDPSTVERVPPQPYEAASPPEFPYPFNTPQLPDPNRVLTLWEFFHKRNYHGKNYPMVLMMLGGPPKELGLTENPAPCPGLSADTTRCLADCLL